jgi:hypothetical protein
MPPKSELNYAFDHSELIPPVGEKLSHALDTPPGRLRG